MRTDLAIPFDVPTNENDDYYRLTDEQRRQVRGTLAFLKAMHTAGKGNARAAYNTLARSHQTIASMPGMTYKSLKRKLALYLKHGNWRDVLDRRSVARPEVGLPREFVEYWRSMFDGNQRRNCGRAEHRRLIEQWYAGQDIPGYGTWRDHWLRVNEHDPIPDLCPEWFVPTGWAYTNLMRKKPPKHERALTRFGIAACKNELLHVPQTREGMRFLEWVTLDDVETDFLITVPECVHPVVMKCLVAKDIATDMGLRFGARPALPKEHEEGNHSLKRQDTKILIAGILRTFGFPTDYITNIIIERGTATLSREDAAALEEITGGHVKIHWTEMIGGKALPHGFADRAIGNPAGKSWLEASFNPLHNALGALPGQKGSHYQLRPKELEGRSAELKALMQAGRAIPPELRVQLRLPFLGYKQAAECIENVLRKMNARTWHKLEGFEEIGLWRWRAAQPAPWQTMETYPVALPPGAETQIEISTRPEAPVERMQRLVQGYHFEKMPMPAMPLFLEKHHEFVTVRGGVIELQINKKPYRFRDEKSGLMVEGAKYLAYYSRKDLEASPIVTNASIDLACLYVTDGKGSYLGKLPLWAGVTRGDTEALAAKIAEKERALKEVSCRIAKRNIPSAEQRLEDIEQNLEVLYNAEAVNITEPQPAGEPEFASSLSAINADTGRAHQRRGTRARVDVITQLRKEKHEQKAGQPSHG